MTADVSPPNEMLIKSKLITGEQLRKALVQQAMSGGLLGSSLVKLGYLTEEQITRFLSKQYGVRSIDLAQLEIDQSVIRLVPREIAQGYIVIPIKRKGHVLTVAMADPSNTSAIDAIRFLSGFKVEPVVAAETSIKNAIDRHYGPGGIPQDIIRTFEDRGISKGEKDNVVEKFLTKLPELLPTLQVLRSRREYSPRRGAQYDLCLDVRIAGKVKRLVLEFKGVGEPRYLYQAIATLKQIPKEERAYPVVAAPYISPEGQKICREAGVGFVDLTGNAFLQFDTVLIERAGRGTPRREKARRRRLFAPKSSRVLRVLLENPNTAWTLSRLAKEANVSIRTAHVIINSLEEKGYARKQRAAIALVKAHDLLDLWAENYSFEVNVRRGYYTFTRSHREFLGKLRETGDTGYALTLHSGASLVAPFVRHTDIHFYWLGNPERIASRLDLRVVETGGNVQVFSPYDGGVFYRVQEINGLRVVCNTQLYLDLIHYPARGKEQADFLRRRKMLF